ncbi:PEGA domain-containing protein [Methanogenium marinum]|uniref:PEGA domain-containing protein n=1 Tax=Methanogenium marinum TaxID=348610 RepID=A0A9Q4KSE2_9EURY|nr:PEGA domain-containing protein [Methanogenium marinum]MDE4907709.1 PEGA domain-containing protein [Methanogenium marinum]
MQNFDESIVHKIVYGHGFSGHGTAKILFAAVFVAMVVLIGVASAGTSFYSGGNGTPGDPYQIHTSSDIRYLSTHSGNWSESFIVTDDIDLDSGGSPTATIGNFSITFAGTFDGKGYTIRNFNLSIAGDYVGLFGIVGKGGNIRNLNVETDANGVHGQSRVGVIVGWNLGSLTNCSATGNVTATGTMAGGLAGLNYDTLTNCYATGNVTAAGDNAGGLVGSNDGGSVTNCSATGDVTATGSAVGGLAGSNSGSLTNCYATGDVTTTGSAAGGLAGDNGGSIMDCYATGSATAADDSAGGLVGWNSGSVTNCYATGSATAGGFAGGLVGHDGGSITNCYATGSATAADFAGGLVGHDGGSITNCYRYTGGDIDSGILITDITKFKDIRFLTGTDSNNGLSWDTGDISTDADSSKIWRVSEYNVQYPIFQWQSFENGTLLVESSPEGATISFNGFSTGEVTNHPFTGESVGVYNVTVVKEGYDSASRTVTLTKDKTEDVSFTLVQHVGTLHINSTPSGASVYLNGTGTGAFTNATLSGQPVGVYNVTVLKDGYDSASRIVTLTKDDTEDVNFTLVQQFGTLQINSTPSGASVYLNGTDTSKLTNVTLTGKPVGTYNVTVTLVGYDSASRTVTLTKDETEDVSFLLEHQVGTLNVNSVPEGASVYLNGTDTGSLTNFTFDDKPVGTYNVTVTLAGYDSASRTVILTKDETEDVSFLLEHQVGTLNVNSVPEGASVYLNGTDTGSLTNFTFDDKPVGTYNVTVALAGYDSASRTVILTKDETEDVSFLLEQQFGTLNVNSFPEGASVYLNGTDTSKLTNVTFDDKPVGTYNVTVALAGYDSASRTVTLSKDETEDVSFLLEHQVGTINVNSVPEGANVYLNGTDTGSLTNVTFDDKPVGTYNVTVALAGYDSASRTVTLTKDETEDVSFTLVCEVGTLQINSTPSGASVYLNGNATGAFTNVTLSGKPVGVYNVTVVKDGYDSASRTVTLTKDETEVVSFTLVQQVGTLQINSTPSGASVYLNGTATGDLTNVTLSGKPVGVYNVTVLKYGYDSASRIVTLTKDNTEDVNFTLVREVGTLQINSTPSGASVYLNGVSTGDVTNHTFTGESVGDYNVTVELAGYDSLSKDVTLADGETKTVGFIFSESSGGDGDGTSGNPYQIHNSSDIRYLSTHSGDWDKHFIVTNDIDLAEGGSPTVTIGNLSNTFTGTFDGQGYTIRNFELSVGSGEVGLFGVVGSGGNIRNLNVETDANGVHGDANVGVIVGENRGSLTNCYATGNVTAVDYAGGLVGQNSGGTITNCYATGNATAGNNAGGLVGYNNGSITNCYATGSATADRYAGGLVGYNNGSITNCYATGSATADRYAGGLVGQNYMGTITNCYATGSATADRYAGGLVGYNNGSITNCYATGNVTAAVNHAGGLFGLNRGGTITNCYRYTGGKYGNQITDITKFKDYSFLTGPEGNGLSWDTEIISTNANSSKIWKVSEYNIQYPIFQWSFENGTLQVESNPVGVTIYLNGVSTGEVTNHAFTGESVGVYNVTVVKDGSHSASRTVTLAKDEVTYVSFLLCNSIDGGDSDDSALPLAPKTAIPIPESVVTPPSPFAVANPNVFNGTARLPVGPDGVVNSTVIIRAGDNLAYLTIGAGVVARDASGIPLENVSIVLVPVGMIPSLESPGGSGLGESGFAGGSGPEGSGFAGGSGPGGSGFAGGSGPGGSGFAGGSGPGESGFAGGSGSLLVLRAVNCTPDGSTFTPAINLTFPLTEEEWDLYGDGAQAACFNITSGKWEFLPVAPNASSQELTIPAGHFSTYALFAEAVPEVALPTDTAGIPVGSSGGSSLWLWGVLCVAVVAVGGLLISRKQNK